MKTTKIKSKKLGFLELIHFKYALIDSINTFKKLEMFEEAKDRRATLKKLQAIMKLDGMNYTVISDL